MKFIFLDYSEEIQKTCSDPAAKRSGKFVQIRSGDTEFIVFSCSQLHPYHANIVERFCHQKSGIKGHYTPKRDNFIIESPGWEVAGGGKWELDEKNKSIRLTGGSMAYGPFERAGLKENLSRAKPGYSIEIS